MHALTGDGMLTVQSSPHRSLSYVPAFPIGRRKCSGLVGQIYRYALSGGPLAACKAKPESRGYRSLPN